MVKCNGAAECKKALLLLKMGRLPEDFVEGMACVGGCVGGPSSHKSEMEAKKSRDKLIAEADARQVLENLNSIRWFLLNAQNLIAAGFGYGTRRLRHLARTAEKEKNR